MPVYMVFMRNLASNEDFSVPLEAASEADALMMCGERHPHPMYAHLTTFTLDELHSMVEDARRWPGVASKVQPSVEEMLRRVNVRIGKLPPLPHERAAAVSAKVEESRGFSRGVMETEAKIATVQHAPAVAADRPAATKAAPASPAAASPFTQRNQGRSVVDVLRALRG